MSVGDCDKTLMRSDDLIRGRRVFLIGGGPSAKGVDFDALRFYGIVVAINDWFRYIPGADIVFTADGAWLGKRAEELKRFHGIRVAAVPADVPAVSQIDPIERLERCHNVAASIDSNLIHCSHNSGFGATNFAGTRKPKQMVLIGFDLNGVGHGHRGYEWRNRFGVEQYPAWAQAFAVLAQPLAARGIDVVNVNAQSAIRCFRFQSLQELLA